MAAKTAWPLLYLTAVLQVYFGLSIVAYVFMGVPNPIAVFGGWIAATFSGLHAVAAVVAFVLAVRRNLRGATLAVAGSIMLGWLSTLPSVVEQGLNFHGDDKVTPAIFVISPLLAIAGATLAWRNVYPIAAALIVNAMTLSAFCSSSLSESSSRCTASSLGGATMANNSYLKAAAMFAVLAIPNSAGKIRSCRFPG